MKTTIIYLGIAVLTITNVKAANELNVQDLVQQDLTTVCVATAQEESQFTLVNKKAGETFVSGEETAIFNPASVIKAVYTKSLEQVVSENKMITEAAEDTYQPISLEMSLEDRISESNQIIESSIGNDFYPLDFEKINRSVKNNKACNHNMAVTIDLKL